MESINVVARFRGAESTDDELGEWELTSTSIKNNEKYHNFNFDAVLSPSDSQAALYEKSSLKLVNSL